MDGFVTSLMVFIETNWLVVLLVLGLGLVAHHFDVTDFFIIGVLAFLVGKCAQMHREQLDI